MHTLDLQNSVGPKGRLATLLRLLSLCREDERFGAFRIKILQELLDLEREQREKSIGSDQTFDYDIDDAAEIHRRLLALSERTAARTLRGPRSERVSAQPASQCGGTAPHCAS